MLEKPNLEDALILSRLQEEFGLQAASITFLPLGADVNAAVYRVVGQDQSAFFLKLRKGPCAEITVALPHFLNSQGNQAIIAPLETPSQRLWGGLGAYRMILYPFVEGKDGYQAALSDRQAQAFGAALKRIHSARLPAALAGQVAREDYSPRWREMVTAFQYQVERTAFKEPVAARLAAFMHSRQAEISLLVQRAGQLAQVLQSRRLPFVLCHGDLHPGNLLLGANDALYIVDWDNPIFAPKEHDLIFAGPGPAGTSGADRQEALFYQGYGPARLDRPALAYYRFERIVQDIAAFCEQLLLTSAGAEDRQQSYGYFISNFLPGHDIDIALATDPGI